MAKIEPILLPQDQRFVLSNGMVNPAWYRFFVALQQQVPELIGLSEQVGEMASFELEKNFLKGPVSDVSTSTLVVGTTFNQAEVQAIATRVEELCVAQNTTNLRLRQSKIVRGS